MKTEPTWTDIEAIEGIGPSLAAEFSAIDPGRIEDVLRFDEITTADEMGKVQGMSRGGAQFSFIPQ